MSDKAVNQKAMSNQEHWEQVYSTKQPEQLSWTQQQPSTSIQFINDAIINAKLDTTARIIDIGGGDSNLVDCLLAQGYSNISVLDISANALQRAQKRLGAKASLVTWIHSDITTFTNTHQYDIWHDRAVFHFLTTPQDIATYQQLASKHTSHAMVIGTFATTGAKQCSGLPVTQYNSTSLAKTFSNAFTLQNSIYTTHTTPFNTKQDFVFCSLTKNKCKSIANT